MGKCELHLLEHSQPSFENILIFILEQINNENKQQQVSRNHFKLCRFVSRIPCWLVCICINWTVYLGRFVARKAHKFICVLIRPLCKCENYTPSMWLRNNDTSFSLVYVCVCAQVNLMNCELLCSIKVELRKESFMLTFLQEGEKCWHRDGGRRDKAQSMKSK